jgi:hypothetical protein
MEHDLVLLTAIHIPSSVVGSESFEELAGSVERESPVELVGVPCEVMCSIRTGGCAKVVLSAEKLARTNVSAKSCILAKRSSGSLASAFLTT